jgi:hypothetical protein
VVSVHCVAAHTGVSTPRHAPPVTSERVQRLLRPTPEQHALSTSETQKTQTQHTSIHVQQPTAHRARARLQMQVVAQPFHGLRTDTPCTLVCSREGRRALMVGELPPSAASRRRRRRVLLGSQPASQHAKRFTIKFWQYCPRGRLAAPSSAWACWWDDSALSRQNQAARLRHAATVRQRCGRARGRHRRCGTGSHPSSS